MIVETGSDGLRGPLARLSLTVGDLEKRGHGDELPASERAQS